ERLREIFYVDQKAAELYRISPTTAREYLTDYSLRTAAALFERWKKLDTYLLVKYMDGNTKKQEEDGSFKNNGHRQDMPASPEWGGYNQKWKEAVVKDHGDVLRVP
ncbi:MAG TPA: dipeptidase, partial [Bacteroidales bacterium]|nr:dipeptidase [Bacteroidales bacterium]